MPLSRTRAIRSSSMQPPETEPTTWPSSQMASVAPIGARAGTPGLDDRDQLAALAAVDPGGAGFQYFEVDAVHGVRVAGAGELDGQSYKKSAARVGAQASAQGTSGLFPLCLALTSITALSIAATRIGVAGWFAV